jgi:hypothetical protein
LISRTELARDLVKILEDAAQVVPPALREIMCALGCSALVWASRADAHEGASVVVAMAVAATVVAAVVVRGSSLIDP